MITPDDKGIQQARREAKLIALGVLSVLFGYGFWRLILEVVCGK